MRTLLACALALVQPALGLAVAAAPAAPALEARADVDNPAATRERLSLNADWRFKRWEKNPDGLTYDVRPDQKDLADKLTVLKPWILPSANAFIANASARYPPPPSQIPAAAANISYAQKSFDDAAWDKVTLPHDWAIAGPFYNDTDNPVVPGSMGRLPVQGVAWYRRRISWTKEEADKGRRAFLDVDGAMSYAMVWLNGALVGGWPYPYNSFRLDLTPYLKPGDDNVLAIRVDNPNDSARWYPGAGLYRNIWLTKTNPVHVAQYGTHIKTSEISTRAARIDMDIQVDNAGASIGQCRVAVSFYSFDNKSGKAGDLLLRHDTLIPSIAAKSSQSTSIAIGVDWPRVWSPGINGEPTLCVAVVRLYVDEAQVDTYETRFGIRSIEYDAEKGLLVNGKGVTIRGVNQHHDLGAIGAAFNTRAAQRRLELLQEMGVNAIRMSHNPPAPELLDLTDRMGFLVIDEIFDSWQSKKTDNDFHLIFDDWHEADLRSMARRDRNHPSIMSWSYGNEVGEQQDGDAGAALSAKLRDMLRDEDPTRKSSASQNRATPDQPWSKVVDMFYLNYQGAGIRDTAAYANLSGFRTDPLYPKYREAFPDKMMLSSESAAALSTRGTYFFPVTNYSSAPVSDASGGNSSSLEVSAYELYSADFGSSPDKVFASQDASPYAAGEFVWTGTDYIGEPTPYDAARSSSFGILDLAGFKKDRFYLYQSRWRPDLATAHIVPHWTWPERVGQVTPVHVFSAADEAELFLNGASLGPKTKAAGEDRFRWDDLVYTPGELLVMTFMKGEPWANATVRTASNPTSLQMSADRADITADGLDLSFITVTVLDERSDIVPRASNAITFEVEGPGEIIATDNGDPADFTPFPSLKRNAYNGLALAVVRGKSGSPGSITVTASTDGVKAGTVVIKSA